jgi:hypothetical protein
MSGLLCEKNTALKLVAATVLQTELDSPHSRQTLCLPTQKKKQATERGGGEDEKEKKENNDKFNDSLFYRNEKRIVVSELIFVFIYFNRCHYFL